MTPLKLRHDLLVEDALLLAVGAHRAGRRGVVARVGDDHRRGEEREHGFLMVSRRANGRFEGRGTA